MQNYRAACRPLHEFLTNRHVMVRAAYYLACRFDYGAQMLWINTELGPADCERIAQEVRAWSPHARDTYMRGCETQGVYL
jgi:hypothetical protein